jgi:hypothetical protein
MCFVWNVISKIPISERLGTAREWLMPTTARAQKKAGVTQLSSHRRKLIVDDVHRPCLIGLRSLPPILSELGFHPALGVLFRSCGPSTHFS